VAEVGADVDGEIAVSSETPECLAYGVVIEAEAPDGAADTLAGVDP
jgi:hypothetical protein